MRAAVAHVGSPRRSATADGLSREDRQRDPDQRKCDQMSARERFIIQKDAEEKRAARRDVLQEADGRQAQMPRSMAEPDERQTGDDAGSSAGEWSGPIRRAEEERAV